MESIVVNGGPTLHGSVATSGAKNAALPILLSALLADGTHEFDRVPVLRDIDSTELKLDRLRRFLQHPVQAFFNQRLNLWLAHETIAEDDETFELDALENWHIKQRLSSDKLVDNETQADRLKAEGLLPHGPAALTSFARSRSEISGLIDKLEDYRLRKCEPFQFRLELAEDAGFIGQINDYYPGKGLMRYVVSKSKGKLLLALWLDHLVLCATNKFEHDDSSVLHSSDSISRFTRLESDQALSQLQQYRMLYLQGLERPLPVFPQASFSWAKASSPEQALKQAYRKWEGNQHMGIGGDKDDPYIKLILRGLTQNPLDSIEFESCASKIYHTLIENLVEV